jgi:hypothetical protein
LSQRSKKVKMGKINKDKRREQGREFFITYQSMYKGASTKDQRSTRAIKNRSVIDKLTVTTSKPAPSLRKGSK